MPKSSLIDLWYRALSSPFGIEVLCGGDINSVRTRLYAERRKAQDLDLEQISVCVSPFDPMKLFMIKRPLDESSS